MTKLPRQSSNADMSAARLLLSRMGITPEQLLHEPATTTMPTFTEYIEQVIAAVPTGTRRAYQPYWNRLNACWGERRLNEPTPLQIHQLTEQIKTNAISRKNSRGGRSAAEHFIAALRCIYHYAEADGLISEADNPASKVAKPRRLTSTRRALPDSRLAQINEAAGATGNDPDLDTLLLRLHTETACRRGGALTLQHHDLDPDQCLIRLREKGETMRWQPVSPTLMSTLIQHGAERANPHTDQVLRYRNGAPITYRRYDHLWARLGNHLTWVATQQVTTHWLRHTTLTWVERHFGYATARAYAGHTGHNDAGTTTTYVRADIHDVAQALAALTDEPHPMASSRCCTPLDQTSATFNA